MNCAMLDPECMYEITGPEDLRGHFHCQQCEENMDYMDNCEFCREDDDECDCEDCYISSLQQLIELNDE